MLGQLEKSHPTKGSRDPRPIKTPTHTKNPLKTLPTKTPTDYIGIPGTDNLESLRSSRGGEPPTPGWMDASTSSTHHQDVKRGRGKEGSLPRNQEGQTPPKWRTSPSTRSQSCCIKPRISLTNAHTIPCAEPAEALLPFATRSHLAIQMRLSIVRRRRPQRLPSRCGGAHAEASSAKMT